MYSNVIVSSDDIKLSDVCRKKSIKGHLNDTGSGWFFSVNEIDRVIPVFLDSERIFCIDGRGDMVLDKFFLRMCHDIILA